MNEYIGNEGRWKQYDNFAVCKTSNRRLLHGKVKLKKTYIEINLITGFTK